MLREFTNDYLDVFVVDKATIGHKSRWYIVDLIYVGRWGMSFWVGDDNELIDVGDFWDNGAFDGDGYHEFMSDLLIPGKWK
jgi:hypothetical protein